MLFDDEETLNMYVEESLEHLSDIENDLLAIEDSGEDIDDEVVNNVFRAAHSIKGGAGFMGLTIIKELSHNLENVLGQIRTRDLVPDPEIISILLKSFDALRDLINNIKESNNVNIDQFVNELINIAEKSLPSEEKESITKKVEIAFSDQEPGFVVSQYEIDLAKKEGKFIYIIEYDMISDIQEKGKNPLEIFSLLNNSGIIIDSFVNLSAVGTLTDHIPARIPFIILFASIIELDMIPTLVELKEKYVQFVSDDMIREPGELSETIIAREPVTKKISEEPVLSTAEPVTLQETPAPQVTEETTMKIKPAVKVEKSKPKKTLEAIQPSTAQVSLRVNVNLLDTLMTLAGELVLSRNQLMQGISATSERAIETSSQRIDMITSELQEAIMQTRMQPISNVFTKFNRVVRDLSKDLEKEIELTLLGKDVELDKTIIEAINDPLTHLVRNSVDHGIESPAERRQNGKDPIGQIRLKAFHEAGQVNIEITDDGKGLDGDVLADSAMNKGLITENQVRAMSSKEKKSLIFLPGFSTAAAVTDVSGRGVGMDVVKTNLDKLGGIIDIDSNVGVGTTINIKLPLTLAIIPSQIIAVGKERFAIPQVNLDELLRIPAAQIKDRIEKVGDANVVRLRGALLPLLNLSDVLEIQKYYTNPKDNKEYPDRRDSIADRRSKQSPMFDPEDESNTDENDATEGSKRKISDRRYRAVSAINIAVVSAGSFKYGLIVDELRDSEEIVVKPLGRHLKSCNGYAGATIMGDGKVALILDVSGLARMANLSSLEGTDRVAEVSAQRKQIDENKKDQASLLLFRNKEDEHLSAPLNLVERIERVKKEDIELVGGKKVVQYRGSSLPLFEISQVSDMDSIPERNQIEVIVFKLAGKEVGLMVTPPIDAVETNLNIDDSTLKQPGIMGSMIINDHTTLMVDMFEVIQTLNPDWFKELEAKRLDLGENKKKILFAEDSAFFRNQVQGFLEDDGFTVISAEDGLEALGLLEKNLDDISLVLTDLEMPNMNGFEFTKKIKTTPIYSHLPVIALTSLAGEADIEKGKKVGIDTYQIKLDREKLIQVVREYYNR